MAQPDWAPRTHADRLGHNGLLTCACGRTTNADLMLDLTSVPPGELQKLGLEKHAATGLCDGCRERLFMTNPDARQILFHHMGSPNH